MTTAASTVVRERRGSRLDAAWAGASPRRQRLVRAALPAAVLGLAAATRLIGLGEPDVLVFDETYYVKDALSLLTQGYEASWPEGADAEFEEGSPGTPPLEAAFVAHPPLGKWVIALGMLALGPADPAGWRLGTAVTGIVLVGLVMLLAHRLLASLPLTVIAGGLVALDGNAIVMSRVALLDGVLAALLVLALLFVALDREGSRRRLAAWLARRRAEGRATDWGPALWARPWMLAAGATLGLAVGVKWSALYVLAAVGVLTVVADVVDRRRAGVALWASGTAFRQAPISFLLLVPTALAAHLLTWWGWFATSGGYDRNWVAEGEGRRAAGILSIVPEALQNLWNYQAAVYRYHVGVTSDHAYEAPAAGWPLLLRPTYMHYEELGDGTAQALTGIPNPLLWWGSVVAVLVLLAVLVVAAVTAARGERDAAARLLARFGGGWPIALVLTAIAAGWLPWLLYPERTMFFFYTVVLTPFLVIAFVMVLRAVLGSADDEPYRRRTGIAVVTVAVIALVAVSAYFLPLWTGLPVPLPFLRAHYWLPTWV
ncbi:phospholipid carrier-dependent glycosyltransferase [Microcella daejeonensis]|uniref:dolichyl-phosphate-mannose--protein mannosyltransferase n=1 Tax=Microcella daejeonensis TaxID=2994971 RepID=UPI0022703D41|nr:phospholipid carrier-dependent glycosyltransferase [Microcella daejeonensis]WAB85117.1 phospholipid carrier-dependent glycosyltransferase [Microcella daejeonensis]